MHRFGFWTKREAVNFALKRLALEPLGLDEARQMRGSGRADSLEEMRADFRR